MNQKNTIREMLSEERPYEKCERFGAGSLTDIELLAVLLRTGTKGESALDLARKLFYPGEGTQPQAKAHLQSWTKEELLKISGIGRVKAIQILCLCELSKRMSQLSAREDLDFSRPDTIAAYYMEQLRHQEQEIMICMMLDNQNHLLGDTMLSKGTVNATLITPREVYLEALRYHAVNLILIHNHPGGNPAPSKCDKEITERIGQAGEMLGINLLDHIIIGDHRYISFREEGLMGAYPE